MIGTASFLNAPCRNGTSQSVVSVVLDFVTGTHAHVMLK
jgi:hypothetical protein